MKTVAITGTRGFVGHMILQALASRKRPPRILAIDIAPPENTDFPSASVEYIQCDLTKSGTDASLAEIFRVHKCDIVIHAALHSQPKRNQEGAHELQSIGSMYVLHAAQSAGVGKVIISSTAEAYGAFPDNPNFLTERHPLRGGQLSRYLRDRVEVEKQARALAKKRPQTVVTILRPCTMLGPNIRNYKTHWLKQDNIPTVMGFDPLVQFVHERDVMRAFLTAVDHDHPGTFNIVGDGVTPLSRALAMMGKTRYPVPESMLRLGYSALWNLQMSQTPPMHVQFMKYSCVADGTAARNTMGFRPVYSLAEVLFSFQGGHESC